MKNKYIVLTIVAVTMLLFSSCNDFLEREPLDNFSDNNFWTSESNVKTYAWKFYDLFMAYGKGSGTSAEFYFQSAGSNTPILISDDLTERTFLPYQPNPSTRDTEWKKFYEFINRANLMLERIPEIPMDDGSKQHWEGVAYFFRAYCYHKLVQRYGDVPYYDKVVTDINDKQIVYLPRTNRNEVMDKVRDDINKAANQLKSASAQASIGENVVNKEVALALKSRIGLYEGTYRKYHKVGDGIAFLQDAKDAAEAIIGSGRYSIPTTTNTFKSVYNSEDLKNNKEMILYKSYMLGLQGHGIQSYSNMSTIINGMTKAAIESYVCTDGLPISQSPKYKGDKIFENIFMDRDVRLEAVVDKEGISYANSKDPISRSRKSSTGYITSLFYNPESVDRLASIGSNTIDAPIFTYAEVLLNYAEATAELGNISQADLDKSVNLLRTRAGVAPLTYISNDNVQASGVTINDPKRTNALEKISGEVSSILWEIRRDRRVELMSWTELRYFDLMRWHKGEYLDYTNNPDVALGAWLDFDKLTEEEQKNIKLDANGYILAYPTNKRVFDPNKHYFNSIPTEQISLYEGEGVTLTQNPGW